MSIYIHHITPGGVSMQVPSDHLDLMAKIQQGDGLVWVGDDRLSVNWDPKARRYCIVRFCEDNVKRPLVWVAPEEFDARVLEWLARADNRRGTGENTIEALEKAEASWQRDRDREAEDADQALIDALKFIERKL